MNNENVIKAHYFSSNHKKGLLKDKKCGCFYCLEIFDPNKINEWVDDISVLQFTHIVV